MEWETQQINGYQQTLRKINTVSSSTFEDLSYRFDVKRCLFVFVPI